MPEEKPTSPSHKEGEQVQEKHKRPIKKKHIWRDFEPDVQHDQPYVPEPDFEPPWF